MTINRTSATFSISLPPEMAAELERVRRHEHRTRSELVREALRHYMRAAEARSVQQRVAKLPEAEPTAGEVAVIKEGSKELAEGKFVTFEQLRHELGHRRQQSRAKKSKARSRR
jgi:metal-responsive CopG/Arc/MetJ family transcriptional regulator